MTYRIVRMFFEGCAEETIDTGLSLADARAHCKDPETSSRTATSVSAVSRTLEQGDWFDGYEEEIAR